MKRYMSDAVVVIDSFPQSVQKYSDDHAIVCVDIVRTTTTAITAVHTGRRCFPAATLDRAISLSNTLWADRPLLAGELGADDMVSFGVTNSPAAMAERDDVDRPLVLLSPASADLLREASKGLAVFLASLRNFRAAAQFLVGRYRKIAIIAAGSKDVFPEEDQLCCAWMANILAESGFRPGTRKTKDLIGRWKDASVEEIRGTKSAENLRNAGREGDLNFILSHVDDIDASFMIGEDEVLMIPRVFFEIDDLPAKTVGYAS